MALPVAAILAAAILHRAALLLALPIVLAAIRLRRWIAGVTTTTARSSSHHADTPLVGANRPRHELAPIWIAGILIRLLLMPFTVHSDIYSIYSRSYDAVSTGHWSSIQQSDRDSDGS